MMHYYSMQSVFELPENLGVDRLHDFCKVQKRLEKKREHERHNNLSERRDATSIFQIKAFVIN